MNFKNLSENLIIVIVSALIGGFIGYTSSTASNKQTIELLRPTIEEAIRKETTSISNEFKTEIKKLKTRGSGVTEIDVKPDIESKIKDNRVVLDSTETTKPKKKRKKFLGIF